jgi:hypothetical protein
MPRQGAHEITAFVPRLQHALRVFQLPQGANRRASPDGSIAPTASGADLLHPHRHHPFASRASNHHFHSVAVVIYDAPEAPNQWFNVPHHRAGDVTSGAADQQ